MTKHQQFIWRVCRYIEAARPILTATELAAELGVSHREAWRLMMQLQRRGAIRALGKGAGFATQEAK